MDGLWELYTRVLSQHGSQTSVPLVADGLTRHALGVNCGGSGGSLLSYGPRPNPAVETCRPVVPLGNLENSRELSKLSCFCCDHGARARAGTTKTSQKIWQEKLLFACHNLNCVKNFDCLVEN